MRVQFKKENERSVVASASSQCISKAVSLTRIDEERDTQSTISQIQRAASKPKAIGKISFRARSFKRTRKEVKSTEAYERRVWTRHFAALVAARWHDVSDSNPALARANKTQRYSDELRESLWPFGTR